MVASAPVAVQRSISKEPLALALRRLAAKGHAEGCQIIDDGFAPFACRVSSSRAGEAPYLVSIASERDHGCDCPGYAKWQRCKHYALALDAAGWLPDPPDDSPPAAPLHILPRSGQRELAAADLAARFPSRHPARSEDLAVA